MEKAGILLTALGALALAIDALWRVGEAGREDVIHGGGAEGFTPRERNKQLRRGMPAGVGAVLVAAGAVLIALSYFVS